MICPRCRRVYEQENIRFCLDDGETLTMSSQALTDAVAIAGGGARDTDVAFGSTMAPVPTRNEGQTDVQVQATHDEGLPPGTKVGEYVIERKIGEGGMGMIFGASHPIIGKQVASVIFYEMIAGRPPFVGETVVKLLHDHMNEPPPPLETVVEKCHPELRTLVAKMLEKEPANRPASMTVVREELSRLRDLAIAEGKPLYGDAMPPQAKRAKKSPLPMVLGGFVGVAAIAVVGLKLTQKPPPPSGPKPGKLSLSTNATAARVFLDKSAIEKSTQPVAAGGGNLRVQVPPNVDWVLRVEADGFKPLTMPFKIGEGDDQALPVVLTPDVKEPPHKPHGGKPVATPTPTPAAPAPSKPKTVENGKFMDPFAN